jgi:hypothetical protein
MCPFNSTILHHRTNSPEAHNTSVTRERRRGQEQTYGAAKGHTLNYDMVEEIEEECGRIYGMKSRSIEGNQIHWLPPAILSQSLLNVVNTYSLLRLDSEHFGGYTRA